MKLNKLTTAVAAVALASSASVVATDHGATNVVAHTPITVAGEIYGSWTNEDSEFKSVGVPGPFGSQFNDEDTSFSTGILKLSFEAQLAENLSARAEIRVDDDDPDNDGDIEITDLYMQYIWGHGDNGNTVVRAGQYKPRLDGNNFQEISDRPIVSHAGSALASLHDVDVMRRVSGIGADWSWSAGTFSSINLWDAGEEFEENDDTTGDVNKFDNETNYTLGYSIRAGWVGNVGDNVQLAVAGTYLDMTVDEESDTNNGSKTEDDEDEADAYNLEVVAKVANFLFSANYADGEYEENDNNGTDPTNRETTESEGWNVQGIWNIKNADRGISSFGEIEGPNVPAGEKAYEVALRFGNQEFEYTDYFWNGTALEKDDIEESDLDSWALAASMWCGPNFRTYLEISNSEEEIKYRDNDPDFDEGDDEDEEIDTVTLGVVLTF